MFLPTPVALIQQQHPSLSVAPPIQFTPLLQEFLAATEHDFVLERHDSTTLRLSWGRKNSTSSPLDLYLSERPDVFPKEPFARIPASDGRLGFAGDVGVRQTPTGPRTIKGYELKIERLAPHQRYFVQVGSGDDRVILGERTLALEGSKNFRDLGGYTNTEGRRVRWGQLFRSDSLSQLSESDWDGLKGLQLSTIVDLRGDSEVSVAPDRLPTRGPKPELVRLPIAADASMASLLVATPKELDKRMAESYVKMAEEYAATVYGPLLKRMADPKSGPVVFHCTAGKDRTGIGAALLLAALKVPESTIVGDYARSNDAYAFLMKSFQENPRYQALKIPAEKIAPLMAANPEWIEYLLRSLKEKYGSVEKFLRTKAGLDEATLSQLRAKLLEPQKP